MDLALPQELDLRSDGPVRILTLNRPEHLNAANGPMHRGLVSVWDHIAADPDARAVVLTGAGRAFSAGGDLPMMAATQADAHRATRQLSEARQIITAMASFPLPVVAAVNGPAVGLGCSLALLCDLVVMAEPALLSDPHVLVGLVAGDGGAILWPLLTSLLRAKEHLLLGSRITAAEAERIGPANRVVPDGEALPAALELAKKLAALPPYAVQSTKAALNLHLQAAMTQVMDYALATELVSFQSDAHRDAVAGLLARSSRANER